MAKKPQKTEKKRINLALQGGGAHGAFTWGVLDRILEEDDIEIAAMSGTSAGALNGAALKAGMLEDGNEGARAKLAWVWEQIGARDEDFMSEWMVGMGPGAVSRALEYSPQFAWMDGMSRIFSPYSYGPLYQNPLKSIVEQFNYGHVCALGGPEFFVCATRVRNGKIRVFKGNEITTDAILASACLPTMFKAVEIFDDETGRIEPFWDGGYTGNPALFPMFKDHLPADVVIININPLEREEVPRTPQQIQNRINEISFNSSLLRELRAIEFVQRLIQKGNVDESQMSRVLVHMISDDRLMNELSVATKLIPTPYVLARLKEAGRAAAENFLRDHKDDIGQRGSVDLPKMFM